MKQWIRFLLSLNFLKTIAAAGLFIAVLVYGSLWWLKDSTMHAKVVEIPNLKLMKLENAVLALEELGLNYEVIDSVRYVSSVPEGAVVESFPKEYAKVKLGRKILLTTNPGRLPKYPLPNYKDQLVSYVSSKFKTKGFVIDKIVAIPDLSHDLVLRVVDAKDSIAEEQVMYPTGSHFTLFVSAGLDGNKVFLPNLVGMTFEEATDKLYNLSLNAGATIYQAVDEDTLGAFVLKTSPAYNPDQPVDINAGSSVDIWLVSDSTLLPVDLPSDLIDTLDVEF